MNVGQIIHLATLVSLLMGGLGVVVAIRNHREQVKTQIFLALSARYDELLQHSPSALWLNNSWRESAERSEHLIISIMRFCTLVSLAYYLFRERRISKQMWELLLRSAERRFRSPVFIREWEQLRAEFEAFPEFVALVTSMHRIIEDDETLCR